MDAEERRRGEGCADRPRFCCRIVSWLSLNFVIVVASSVLGLAGTVHVPTRDDELVALVPRRGVSSAERQIEELRRRLLETPRDAESAVRLVRGCLDLDHTNPDPRWLGLATAALSPWSDAKDIPTEIRLARAILSQRSHDFGGALQDLDSVLVVSPRNAEAWLVKSTLHVVRGEYDPARRAAGSLFRLTDPLTATTAAATVASLSGSAARSCELLERVMGSATNSPTAGQIWALTQLAETRERLGKNLEAELAFRKALGLAPRDPYLVGAFSDFLLQTDRAQEALALLEPIPSNESLLLRWVEANRQLGRRGTAYENAVRKLEATFAVQAARGERVHRREEARFRLHVLDDAVVALRLARENWEIQREPADLVLLHQAALAVHSEPDLQRVRDWLAATHLEDVRLNSVVKIPERKVADVHR